MILQRLVQDFSGHDSKIFIEEEDPTLANNGTTEDAFGPNPKIRNMSRGYREAKGDLVWLIDCNVWVGRGACGRMVDKLCGFTPKGGGDHINSCITCPSASTFTAVEQVRKLRECLTATMEP